MNPSKILLQTVEKIGQDLPPYAWVLVALAAFLLLAAWYDRKRHWTYRLDAWGRLRKLSRLPDDRARFLFLRDTHHFTFEEMILTALKRKGHKITRNKGYTGDGGIDGRVTIRGIAYYIQAKRYSGHINAQHVREFGRICQKAGVKGLFIHTGRTGKESRLLADQWGVKIISGSDLFNLFLPKPVSKKDPGHA